MILIFGDRNFGVRKVVVFGQKILILIVKYMFIKQSQ